MREFSSHVIGIDQGNTDVFSDFENDGAMWVGEGPRERRQAVQFSRPFRSPPLVQVSLSLWDFHSTTNIRADIAAESITSKGFEIVFCTWGDTRIARARVAWTAIGEARHADDWDV